MAARKRGAEGVKQAAGAAATTAAPPQAAARQGAGWVIL